jgi:alpha-amylase
MRKLQLIFGTYNTQPVGSYDYVLERAYQQAYKPFLTVLYGYREIPVAQYYSGSLLLWLEERHPEFLMLLSEMAKRKQVELLGGGFYDPAFPLLPVSDRLGQIEALTTYLRKHFGRRPRGIWITERVWEPSLTSTLRNSGMDYSFLDDTHFRVAGLLGRDIHEPCITEDQGKTVTVFPVCTELAGSMPEGDPGQFISKLRRIHENDEAHVAVLMVSGEQLGDWDDSHKRCYDDGWLHELLGAIQENSDWLEPTHPSRYLRAHGPNRKVYFPCVAHEDLMRWALPPDRQVEYEDLKRECLRSNGCASFVAGGFFRQFLTKYPESNLLYSKMIYTHILVNQLRGDKYRKKAAREELWRGQCHSPYWHGRYDGLYLGHLRKEAYRALIEAEKITREKGIFIPSVIATDFDMDGEKEYLYQGHEINAYVHVRGGVLFELDYLPTSWNYLDTLSRHREIYHKQSIADDGYDWYPRRGFIDHFMGEGTTIHAFDTMHYTEEGDFVETPYQVADYDREHHELTVARTGTVRRNGQEWSVELRKRYVFKRTAVELYYTIHNAADAPLQVCFATEVNLALASRGMEGQRIYRVDQHHRRDIGTDPVVEAGTTDVLVEDVANDVVLSLSSSLPAELWSLPVDTSFQTRGGMERYHQSSCLLLRFPLNLAPDQSWENHVLLGLDGA